MATEDVRNALISIRNVSKVYGHNKHQINALNDVTVDIQGGSFVAITGASGSGKSTLLQLLGALDTPTGGTVEIDGVDVNSMDDVKRSEFRSKTVGFVFQFFYLQPFLSVADNVAVPGMFTRAPARERKARISELLNAVGVGELVAQFPSQLSGGQTQRVAIARALLNRPKILLADEPTGNLDSANSKAIIDLFLWIRQKFGTTIVIVTHNADIAKQADNEIRLKDGRLA